MSVVDLKSITGAPVAVKFSTVVNFKETRANNILLCAGSIYIYTMRASPKELRIIDVTNGNNRFLFKEHTNIPTVAKMTSVGIRQQMIASGSDSELFVWSHQAQSITTFFKWTGVTVSALEWVKGQSTSPSLIVLYSKDGGAKKLGVVNTKKIMDRYSKAGLDAQAVEVTAEDINEPTLGVDGCDLLAAGSFGEGKAIAVASTTKAAVNVVFSTNTTAQVSLPDSEPVSSIYINDDFFLIVGGAKGTVVAYNLRTKDSESPKAVFTAKLPAPVTASASLANVVSYVCDDSVYSLQITVDGAKVKSLAITEAVQSFILVEDSGVIRGVFDSQKFLTTGVAFDKNNFPVAMEVTKSPAVAQAPLTYTATVSPSTLSRVQAPSLKNNTLANVAVPSSIAAAQTQASNEIEGSVEDLRSTLAATQTAVAEYGGKTHKMDLEMVIQHALEAQVAELLKLRLSAPNSASSTSVSGDLDEAFVSTFRANLANNISAGIAAAVEQVADSLVAKVRETGKKNAKKAGTDALKRRLDEFVGEANTVFANALSDRMRNGEATFKHSVAHLNRVNDEAVRVLQQQVDDLNGQLRTIASSGIIEEVKRLRKEVSQLKSRVAGNVTVVPVSPDTLIQTAIATIDSGNVVGGFEYAAATNQSAVVAAVLSGVKAAEYEASTLPSSLWSSVLTLGAIGAQSKDEAVALLNAAEVVKDDETILSVNSGKARVALKAFCGKWKSTFATESALRNQLKSLDIELGSK